MQAYRALIVDDDLDIADSLSSLLELEGCETRIVATGAEAIALADEFEPVCVLLDLNMPGMSGAQMAERLRARFSYDVVLIAVTGYDSQSREAQEARHLGVDYVMTKPIDFEKLVRIMGIRA